MQYSQMQSIALKGDSKEYGNFHQLMRLMNKFCPVNHDSPYKYLSQKMQNEIIHLMVEDVH